MQDGSDASFVKPVCLPLNADDPGVKDNTGLNMQVTGWGRISNNERFNLRNFQLFGAGSRTLQKVEIPVVSPEVCDDKYGLFNKDTQLCAGGVPGKDSCGGDSGGPLTYRTFPDRPWYQIGIVSHGKEFCGSSTPAVYTYVPHFIPWIKRSIKP